MITKNHAAFAKHRTGKTPEELSVMAKAQNLMTHNEVVDWLKTKFELSHGHATTISRLVLQNDGDEAADKKSLAARFKGPEADWLPACHELFLKIGKFGADSLINLNADPIEFSRNGHVFGLLSLEYNNMLIGIRLPGAPYNATFMAAADWNTAVTHKVTIVVQQQIDDALIDWLQQAYDSSVY